MKMESKIGISDSSACCVIDIEGIIGVPEECQFDEPSERVATYEKFRSQVERISQIEAPEVEVNIRSAGGDVNDALLIYEALASLGATIRTRCYGYTASAATIIAQAAGEGCREISANALYLIHNSSCSVEGNAAELSARVELLQKTDERIAALYAARSGRPAEEFAALMSENGGSGRWLSPQEALEAGLVDRIVGEERSVESPVRAIAGRIGRLFGIGRETELPECDRNILHEPGGESVRERSAIVFEENQNAAPPTSTLPREDPGADESRLSPNAAAYAEDARCFRRL